MLVEPPGPHLPAGAGLIASPATAGRLAASAAALVLAATSRGDALVLAVALVLAAARLTAVPALLAALAASSLRWGATSLEALSGAQAVLGPAGWVGPTSDALGSWLAGAALLLALVPDGAAPLLGDGRWSERLGAVDILLAGAAGATVAAVVAGPSPGGDVWIRVAAAVGVAGLALVLATLRRRHRDVDVGFDIAAAVAGVAALVAVRADGGAWSGLVEAAPVGEGAAVAVAVGAAVLGGSAALVQRRHARWSLEPRAA